MQGCSAVDNTSCKHEWVIYAPMEHITMTFWFFFSLKHTTAKCKEIRQGHGRKPGKAKGISQEGVKGTAPRCVACTAKAMPKISFLMAAP